MSSDSDLTRISRLIWKGDNTSAVAAIVEMKDANEEATASIKGDAEEQSASFAKTKESALGLRDAMVGLAGMVGIGGVAFGFKDLVEGGEQLQESQTQLRASMRSTKTDTAAATAELEKYATSLSTKGGFGVISDLGALTQYVTETHSAAEAQSMLGLATNIARARNMGLAQSQTIVAKAYDGQARGLQALLGPMVSSVDATVGLTTAHQQQIATLENEASMMGKMGQVWLRQQEVNDHITAQQTELAQLENKRATGAQILADATAVFAGRTSAYNETTKGQFSDIDNAMHNLTESLGVGLLPAMDDLAHVGADVAGWMAKDKDVIRDVVLAVTGLGAAWAGMKIVKGIETMVLDLGKAFGVVTVSETEAAAAGVDSADTLTIAWDSFMEATIVGLVLVGLVEMVEHWHAVETAAVSVWHTVSGAAVDAWHWIENAADKGVDWVWGKIKWLGDEAKKIFADTPLGGLIGFGSNLLSGHVGRAFGDLAQGATGGAYNAQTGSIGVPFRNVFESSSSTPSHITITPQTTTLKVDNREIGRATTRWMLDQAARGPSTVNGAAVSFPG